MGAVRLRRRTLRSGERKRELRISLLRSGRKRGKGKVETRRQKLESGGKWRVAGGEKRGSRSEADPSRRGGLGMTVSGARFESGGFLEFDFGGVAEGEKGKLETRNQKLKKEGTCDRRSRTIEMRQAVSERERDSSE